MTYRDRFEKRERIAAAMAEGEDRKELAQRFDVSARQVRRIAWLYGMAQPRGRRSSAA